MSEYIIYCNEQNINCDSEKFYCDGSQVIDDEEYSTATYYEVEY